MSVEEDQSDEVSEKDQQVHEPEGHPGPEPAGDDRPRAGVVRRAGRWVRQAPGRWEAAAMPRDAEVEAETIPQWAQGRRRRGLVTLGVVAVLGLWVLGLVTVLDPML